MIVYLSHLVLPLCMHALPAKSHQSCPTLCDVMADSPPGSLSKGFFRQESWSGLPCPSPGHLLDLGIELTSACISCTAGRFFTHWVICEAFQSFVPGVLFSKIKLNFEPKQSKDWTKSEESHGDELIQGKHFPLNYWFVLRCIINLLKTEFTLENSWTKLSIIIYHKFDISKAKYTCLVELPGKPLVTESIIHWFI